MRPDPSAAATRALCSGQRIASGASSREGSFELLDGEFESLEMAFLHLFEGLQDATRRGGGGVAESLQPTNDEAVLGDQLKAEVHSKPRLFKPLRQQFDVHRAIVACICVRRCVRSSEARALASLDQAAKECGGIFERK